MKFRRLIFANLFRKKIRLILTIGSFAVALFLFSFLAVVKGAFGRGADIAGADRLVIINRISIIQPLPLSYRDKILRIPGVKAITHNNWFGGVYQDEKNFFPQFAIDVENQRKVLPELKVPDDQWANFVKDRQGAIAGAKTAARFGWKIGDRIPIKTTIFGGANTWEFNLDGIYHSNTVGGDESQFWFQWDAFEEGVPKAFKDNVGWYVLKLDSPDDAVRVSQSHRRHVCQLFVRDQNRNRIRLRRGMGQAVRQHRIPDPHHRRRRLLHVVAGHRQHHGHLRARTHRRTRRAQSHRLQRPLDAFSLFWRSRSSSPWSAACSGLGLAALAIPVLAAALNGLLPTLILSPAILSVGLGTALLVGVVSGLLPGIGAMRMRVVNALRRV